MRFYPSKILLFGEYAIINGSDSLAVPYHGYKAKWSYNFENVEFRKSLYKYLQFFENQSQTTIDVVLWKKQMEKGLCFDSTIPSGYGVGSSGSLVAGVYDRFGLNKFTGIEELRPIFQWMESFFHGTSSGIDPLVSYYDAPIHVSNGSMSVLDNFDSTLLSELFLFNSGKPRSTTPLVTWYKEQMENEEFSSEVFKSLIPLNIKAIQHLLDGNAELFVESFQDIAEIEKRLFTKMFPFDVVEMFQLESIENYKLCGAGGGGFYLVLDKKRAHKNLQALL